MRDSPLVRDRNIDACLTDSVDSVALDRNAVAPACDFLGAIDGIALDNGLEVNGVVQIDAVNTKIADMYRVVKGTFEDYGLGGLAAGTTRDNSYTYSHYHHKQIEIADY